MMWPLIYLNKCVFAISSLECIFPAIKRGEMLVSNHTTDPGTDLLSAVPAAIATSAVRRKKSYKIFRCTFLHKSHIKSTACSHVYNVD